MPKIAFAALLYLLEVTRSIKPVSRVSARNPRSYAPWSVQEDQLVTALDVHGFDREDVAALVERTEYSLQVRNDKRDRQGLLNNLPCSDVPMTEHDFDLLKLWKTVPPRDPLGWRYGKPAPPERLAPASVPTLRIIEVAAGRRDAPLNPSGWHPTWSRAFSRNDLDDAARSTWIDLAALLVQENGLVLLPTPDPQHKSKLAIREAIRRVRNVAAPKLTVLTYPFPSGPPPHWESQVVLIDRPELWSRSAVASLQANTVVLVLPDLNTDPPVSGRIHQPAGPDLSTLPFLLQDIDSRDPWRLKEQEALISRWSPGRRVERQSQVGVPNSSGMAARLDWPALQLLPANGQVAAIREDLLVRAAVWYTLMDPARPFPCLPDDVAERVRWVGHSCHDPSLEDRARQLHQDAEVAQRSAVERVMGRVWLDLLSAPLPAQHSAASVLTFELDEASRPAPAYIGR